MLGAVWAVYAGFGLVAGSLAPVVGAVRADLGLSRSAMGLVLGTWQLVYLVSAIPAGAFIRRVGLRTAIFLAAVIVAASGVTRALATNLPMLLAAVAVFGFGGPLISIGAPQLIADWFDAEERRTAVGVYTTAPAVGTMLALATANSVLVPAFGSWRWSVAIYGCIAGSTGLLWLAVARGRASAPSRRVEQAPAVGANRALLGVPVVRVVLLLALGSFLFSHALSNWLVEILRDGGRSSSWAGTLAALTTLVGVAATAVVPRLAVASRRVVLLVAVYLAGAVAVAALTLAPGGWVVAPLVVIGIARASSLPIAMLVLMDHRDVGASRMAAAGGLYFTAGEIGGVLGPLAVGAVADLTAGYRVPTLLLAAVAAAMAALVVVGRRVVAPEPVAPEPSTPTSVPLTAG